jgi:hypothetical protein
MILRSVLLLLVIVHRLVLLHVAIVHWGRWRILRVMILIVRSSPAHILLHILLPCRQRTTVHHTGLGDLVQTNRVLRRTGVARIRYTQPGASTRTFVDI